MSEHPTAMPMDTQNPDGASINLLIQKES
jgi:hypothetical protein